MPLQHRSRSRYSFAEYGLLAVFFVVWILIALDTVGVLPGQ